MPPKPNHRKTFGELFDVSASSVGTITENRKIIRKTTGKRTKMGFVEFLNHLFDTNENPARRHPDGKLKAMILDEFSHSKKTLDSFFDGNQTVAKLRHEYNTGCFQPSTWPPEHPGKLAVMSVRYNEEGVPANSRRPQIPATEEHLLELHAKFPRVQETAEQLIRRTGIRNKR